MVAQGDDVEQKQIQYIVFRNIYCFNKLPYLVRAIIYHKFGSFHCSGKRPLPS